MSNELDDHGQPIAMGFNWKRLEDSRMDELIGLCRGILADGVLVYEEACFLRKWLNRNTPVRRAFPGRELYAALDRAIVDGKLTFEGEQELVGLLAQIIGGMPSNAEDASFSTTLPLDNPPPEILFVGKSFCFTGKFLYGERTKCKNAVIAAGGLVHADPTQKTDYLVIGVIGSRDWAHSVMGRKIERALAFREERQGIKIVSEAHWAKSLPKSNTPS
jgi:hypothetical protein